MDAKYSLDVTLTKADVEALISESITKQVPGYEVESITFTLKDESGYQDRYSTRVFDSIKVKMRPKTQGSWR